MGLIEEIRARNENELEAACDLGLGLMRGRRAELKLGYSAGSALRTACDLFTLNAKETEYLWGYMRGFAQGMVEDQQQTYPAGSRMEVLP